MLKEREKKLKKLGNKIKRTRRNKDLTLQQLGKLIGYTAASISRWENGLKEPKYGAIKMLEQQLKIKL